MESANTTLQVQLSVIIALMSDTTAKQYDPSILSGCLESLYHQIDPPVVEIIVPYPAQLTGLDLLKESYPDVIFLPISDLKKYRPGGGSREHHNELRARGIAIAKGELIALIEDVGWADERWSANLVRAHIQNFAAIGGAIENGIDRSLNWGVYFCDFGKYQSPIEAGKVLEASDANISYKADALGQIKDTWQDNFYEPAVNLALHNSGKKIALSPDIVVYQHRTELEFQSALKERYIWGRSFAAQRTKQSGWLNRIIRMILTPIMPLMLALRMSVTVIRKGNHVARFVKTLPIILLLLVFWSVGEFCGYLTGRPAN